MISYSQDAGEQKRKEPETKLEAFLAKKGTLIIKDVYNLGEINGKYGGKITFSALVIYEPGQESQKIRGLKIEITGAGRFERSNTSFLDLEEIQSLSKAIEYMVNVSAKWKDTSKEYTEVIFSTKGYFNIGFYQKGIEQTGFTSSGYIGETTCFLSSIQDLISIKTIVDKGLNLLNTK
jgi:hypothetical protein